MQRIAFLQSMGVALAFCTPFFIGKEFYFISLACVLSSVYFVIRGGQFANRMTSSVPTNNLKM